MEGTLLRRELSPGLLPWQPLAQTSIEACAHRRQGDHEVVVPGCGAQQSAEHGAVGRQWAREALGGYRLGRYTTQATRSISSGGRLPLCDCWVGPLEQRRRDDGHPRGIRLRCVREGAWKEASCRQ
eukprot:Skav216198  [mRNA]  locus=scaffold1222:84196:85776:- [translate_table: standard]